VRYVRVGSSRSGSLDLWRICTGVRGCLLFLLPVKELVMAAATSFVEGEGIASGGSGGVASGPGSPLRRSLTTCHGLGAGG
jgi:hypothetical protein